MPNESMNNALLELRNAVSALEAAKTRTGEARTELTHAEEDERAAHVVASAARKRIEFLEAEPEKAKAFDREVVGLREMMSHFDYPGDRLSATRGRVRRELDVLVSNDEASYAERLERLRRLRDDFDRRYVLDQNGRA